MTKEERIADMMLKHASVNEQIAKKRGSRRYISPYSKEIEDSIEQGRAVRRAKYFEVQKEVEGLDITLGDLHFAESFYAGEIQLNTVSHDDYIHTAKVCRDVLIKAKKWTDDYERQYKMYVGIHSGKM